MNQFNDEQEPRNNELDWQELFTEFMAGVIILSTVGTLAYWFFTAWAKQLGIIFTIG